MYNKVAQYTIFSRDLQKDTMLYSSVSVSVEFLLTVIDTNTCGYRIALAAPPVDG